MERAFALGMLLGLVISADCSGTNALTVHSLVLLPVDYGQPPDPMVHPMMLQFPDTDTELLTLHE